MGIGVAPVREPGKLLLKVAKVVALSLNGLHFATPVVGGAQGVGQLLDEFELLGIAQGFDGPGHVFVEAIVHTGNIPQLGC